MIAPLIRPPLGPTDSGHNSESVFIAKPKCNEMRWLGSKIGGNNSGSVFLSSGLNSGA